MNLRKKCPTCKRPMKLTRDQRRERARLAAKARYAKKP